MVSISGMAVSLKTDLRFPVTGQQGHGSRNIQLEKKCKELNCKDGASNANRDVVLMAAGSNRESFSNKELYDHGMKILNMIYEIKPTDIKEASSD